MGNRISDDAELIDHKTSRSICDAVGEKLQQSLSPSSLQPSSHLEQLMDELRRRDRENHGNSSNR